MWDQILGAFGMMGSMGNSGYGMGYGAGDGGYYGDPNVFPGIGMGGMVQNELAFSSMMDIQARQFCANWYEDRQEWRRQNNYWGYLPGPVTTATWDHSLKRNPPYTSSRRRLPAASTTRNFTAAESGAAEPGVVPT